MKQVQITLRHKKTQNTITYFCHHYSADSRCYYLHGVKGHKDYGFGMAFNKVEWERI